MKTNDCLLCVYELCIFRNTLLRHLKHRPMCITLHYTVVKVVAMLNLFKSPHPTKNKDGKTQIKAKTFDQFLAQLDWAQSKAVFFFFIIYFSALELGGTHHIWPYKEVSKTKKIVQGLRLVTCQLCCQSCLETYTLYCFNVSVVQLRAAHLTCTYVLKHVVFYFFLEPPIASYDESCHTVVLQSTC